MALLSFPPSPYNGEMYPVNPPAGTNVYTWSSTDFTWRLLGTASGVIPGTYGNALAVPQITVDITGRITVAVDVPIQLGTTSQIGLVQLVDDTVSNDPTKALTAAQGYKLQNEIGDVSQLDPLYPNLVTAVNALAAPTGVVAGTYGNGMNVAQFTVTANGRITSAVDVPLARATTTSTGVIQVGANLDVTPTGVLSVPNSSTTMRGVVELVNDTVTNDATKALTAAQGYELQLQIDDLNIRNNLTFAGTINGTTGLMVQVTAEGTGAGFAAGFVLPVPTSTNIGYFVIVTAPGTLVPTNSPTVTVKSGDWLISDGTTWVLYAVGPTPPGLVFFDDISGLFDGVRTSFLLRIGGAVYSPSPSTNLLVFVGGVLQVAGPGASYTVSGSTINFNEAPQVGTTFVGVTIR